MVQADLLYDTNLSLDLGCRKNAYAFVSVLSIAFAPSCPGDHLAYHSIHEALPVATPALDLRHPGVAGVRILGWPGIMPSDVFPARA